MLYALVAVLVFFTASPALAQKTCTQIGCVDGLMLTADPSFDWDGGIYEIHVSADNARYKCWGVLPLRSCEGGEKTFKCNSPNIMIGERGCMLPGPKHAISHVYLKGEPRRVSLRITRNRKAYFTRTLAPDYRTVRPNGPGCGPVCRSAAHNLLVAE